MSQQKYCSYGRHFVPRERARLRPKPKGAPPTYICDTCADVRRLPKETLDRMTQEEREARRASSSLASKEALKKRKETQ